MEKKVPIRTCIVCRSAFPKKELNRIVKSGEEIFLDKTGKANGRGAYVCNNPECIKKLKKSKGLNRVFSCQVDDAVYDKIAEEFLDSKK
ncbi:MAG: YlxR family protein [Clostridia bacterium]|nr:YlxR family protein [Clostridia bacterium]